MAFVAILGSGSQVPIYSNLLQCFMSLALLFSGKITRAKITQAAGEVLKTVLSLNIN